MEILIIDIWVGQASRLSRINSRFRGNDRLSKLRYGWVKEIREALEEYRRLSTK